MTSATDNKLTAALSVETDDLLQKAIAAAQERAAKVYSHGRKTLIDQIPLDQWLEWDGTGDLAVVSDPEGLDDEDDGFCGIDAAA